MSNYRWLILTLDEEYLDFIDKNLAVERTFSSLKISVKNPGSLLIRSISELSRLTIKRHRSQNLSLLSSTRNGFSG